MEKLKQPGASREISRGDARKVFEDAYEAIFEQPVGASEQDLQALSKRLLEAVPVMEHYLHDPEFTEDAMRNITMLAHAHEGLTGLFPEDLEVGEIARRIVNDNLALIVTRALESQRNDGFELFRSIEALRKDERYKEAAEGLIGSSIERAGFDYQQLRDMWKQASNPKDEESALQIMRLDHRIPGLPKALNAEFGIVNFRRYPEALLVRQFTNRNRTDIPYGILLYPMDDHNGAFNTDGSAIGEFADSLEDSFELRVVECDGKRDIARQLIRLDQKYAAAQEGHKISFAVIGGHGNEDVIVFGGTDDRHRVHKSDFLARGVNRASSFFTDHPTLILISCSTGKENGIAQELSSSLHATVIAPEANTSVPLIRFDSGRNVFDVAYERGVETMTYRDGNRDG